MAGTIRTIKEMILLDLWLTPRKRVILRPELKQGLSTERDRSVGENTVIVILTM